MNDRSKKNDMTFLRAVSQLDCLSPEKTDGISGFADDCETLYATLFSIIEYSGDEHDTEKAAAELKVFADSLQISASRQRDLRKKVEIAEWDAGSLIQEYGIKLFIDDFVDVCLQDGKLQLHEYRLLVRVCNCIDSKAMHLHAYDYMRTRMKTKASPVRYRMILFFQDLNVSLVISSLIFLNAVHVWLTFSPWFESYKPQWFDWLGWGFLGLFSVEILCKAYAFNDFFRKGKNWFDLVVIGISWILFPIFRFAPSLSALRIFRVIWESDRKLWKEVSCLDCLSPAKTGISEFADDAEALFATLYSIIRCVGDERVRQREEAALTFFADSVQIAVVRQRDLCKKVDRAKWDARPVIQQYGITSFIDGFVAVCQQDGKFDQREKDLLTRMCNYINSKAAEPLYAYYSKERHLKEQARRYRVLLFFKNPIVSYLISFLIILNAILLGLMVMPRFEHLAWVRLLDLLLLFLFSVEMLCKIYAFRRDFFREGSNWFDFIVIGISWIPGSYASALRSFRALLLLNRFPRLKIVVRSLLNALPSIGWVFVLLLIDYYVFAVMATSMFRDVPEFQSLEHSFLSLFQLMTLESWPDLLLKGVLKMHPYSLLVFIPFIVLTSYILLNLVTSIFVDTMQEISLKRRSTEKREIDEIWELKEQVSGLAKQIKDMSEVLQHLKDGKK